jgi:hypothetical protein
VIVKGGSLTGNVRAAHSIELYVPAQASGTLHAPEVHIEKGVQFSGTCTIGPLDAPLATAAPPAATAAPPAAAPSQAPDAAPTDPDAEPLP